MMEVLQPDWPAPPRVRTLHSLRTGGVSQPPYAELNLGDHVGDVPEAVHGNRERLAERLGAAPTFMQQVHGTVVANLPSAQPVPVADACTSRTPGTVCTIMVADCLAVLFCDTEGRAVAAAHAGWRGLAGGVLEQTVACLRSSLPTDAELLGWLGPCIGPTAFEVGDEVRAAFVEVVPAASALFQAHGPGKWLADLPALARQRLASVGVDAVHGNDGSAAWCTVSQPSRFFSHRRDGVSGRMAACVWLVD